MTETTTKRTNNTFKELFAAHGYPDIMILDNCPQFASAEFTEFMKDCNLAHVTSTQYCSKAKGEAVRAVRTIKSVMKKSTDLQDILLNCRSSPLENDFTLAELLFGDWGSRYPAFQINERRGEERTTMQTMTGDTEPEIYPTSYPEIMYT